MFMVVPLLDRFVSHPLGCQLLETRFAPTVSSAIGAIRRWLLRRRGAAIVVFDGVLRKYSYCALLWRVLTHDSNARLRYFNRIFVMQATKYRFHKDERIRRQAMAGLQLQIAFMFLRRIRHPRP
jgi:hypothetical protein